MRLLGASNVTLINLNDRARRTALGRAKSLAIVPILTRSLDCREARPLIAETSHSVF
jgi:hypothetical protein